ncbi:hypothetical protein SLA2020_134810 [Shorea laevis]
MVLKKLVRFIYNLIGLRAQARIKDAVPAYVVVRPVSEMVEEGALSSPAESSSSEALEGEICCVCLSKLKKGEETRVLPCFHKFHRACVDKWLDGCRKTCPVCRFLVQEGERFNRREDLTEEMMIWFSSFHVAGF